MGKLLLLCFLSGIFVTVAVLTLKSWGIGAAIGITLAITYTIGKDWDTYYE